jgi:heme-degrading monooxygenase HmoA
MGIVYINEFQAKLGQGERLLELLKSYDSIYKFMNGYRSLQVLQSAEDPSRIMVIESWDSIGAHQTAVKKTPIHAYEEVMRLSVGSPKGAYYRQ